MLLDKVYVRFFRSFNFDYLRQNQDNVEQFPWDLVSPADQYYPFVVSDLESDITTVVGANESGKSQLISAIQCLLGSKPVLAKDFCRYSSFFGVRASMPKPEFGGHFDSLSEIELLALQAVIGSANADVASFWFFRLASGPTLFIKLADGSYSRFPIDEEVAASLHLPIARVIDADVALPQNISLHALARGAAPVALRDRKNWYSTYRTLHDNESIIDTLGQNPGALAGLIPPHSPITDPVEADRRNKSFQLAHDLFVKVAKVAPEAFSELLNAGGDDDGYGDALAAHMTDDLAASLNFPYWWSQDRHFALQVRKDGFYLVLTMRDRTGQTYTFDERSGGMKYFLSYFVQYMVYAPQDVSRNEILLMDEPDAFLSTQGQQDLLRVFDAYAHPDPSERVPVQVLYVTHSPFLIDKNHPERIRVLQKGIGEEGTRVVRKASVNKYEPLRSAFGSFHADTAFIGNCNLLVEGPADQVLFAGISSAIRVHGFEGDSLDLNSLTVVPVHGASQYRYTLHLTRGRDVDRPAVIVLLDSDPAGLEIRPNLELGYKDQKLIQPEFIFAIGDLDPAKLDVDVSDVQEPEDLVPAAVALEAINYFAAEVFSTIDASKVKGLLPDTLKIPVGARLFDVAQKAASLASADCTRELDLGKVEFARAVSNVARSLSTDLRSQLLANFSLLFHEINSRKSQALSEHENDRVYETTKRLVARFKRDHRSRVSKQAVSAFLDEVVQHLTDASPQSEGVRRSAREITDVFALSSEPLADVADFEALKTRLGDLVYGATRDYERAAV